MYTGIFGPVLSEKYSTVGVMYGTTTIFFAVAVCKGTTVVGHVPRKICGASYVFLGKTGATITGTVTGPRCYSHNLPQRGMEIPWVRKFADDK